jgi:hypothetical protein
MSLVSRTNHDVLAMNSRDFAALARRSFLSRVMIIRLSTTPASLVPIGSWRKREWIRECEAKKVETEVKFGIKSRWAGARNCHYNGRTCLVAPQLCYGRLALATSRPWRKREWVRNIMQPKGEREFKFGIKSRWAGWLVASVIPISNSGSRHTINDSMACKLERFCDTGAVPRNGVNSRDERSFFETVIARIGNRLPLSYRWTGAAHGRFYDAIAKVLHVITLSLQL